MSSGGEESVPELRTTTRTEARNSIYEQAISGPEISLHRVKALAFRGIPVAYRATYWKLLLNYLPLQRDQWTCVLGERRQQYQKLLREFYIHPHLERRHLSTDGGAVMPGTTSYGKSKAKRNLTGAGLIVDHPLCTDVSSSWNAFFEDNQLIHEIEKDVARTLPYLRIFNKDSDLNQSHFNFEFYGQTVERVRRHEESSRKERSRQTDDALARAKMRLQEISSSGKEVIEEEDEEKKNVVERVEEEKNPAGSSEPLVESHVSRSTELAHVDSRSARPHRRMKRGPLGAMLRVLFIYAKLNKGIGYAQGMNDVLAPFIHTFLIDEGLDSDAAEADALFCFSNLMSLIRDHFMLEMDSTSIGMDGKLQVLDRLLQEFDYQIWHDLFQKKIIPQFYAFRWVSLCLAREFLLPDVKRFWDSLFSHDSGETFLIYLCCAMVITVRSQLLKLDFTGTMEYLQKYPGENDPNSLIELAERIYAKHFPNHSPGIPADVIPIVTQRPAARSNPIMKIRLPTDDSDASHQLPGVLGGVATSVTRFFGGGGSPPVSVPNAGPTLQGTEEARSSPSSLGEKSSLKTSMPSGTALGTGAPQRVMAPRQLKRSPVQII